MQAAQSVVDKAVVEKIEVCEGRRGKMSEELFVPEKLGADHALPERATREGAWTAPAQEFTNQLARNHHNPQRHIATIEAAMARGELSRTLWSVAEGLRSAPQPRCSRTMRLPYRSLQPAARFISTTPSRSAELISETPEPAPEPFTAAPEFRFEAEEDGEGGSGGGDNEKSNNQLLSTLRVIPASRSYFSAKPTFTDDYLHVSALLRSVATLPTILTTEAPRVAWKTIDQYRIMTNEPVKTQRFHKMMHVVKRLNLVHPSLMPEHIKTAMQRFMKDSQPGDIVPEPQVVDEWGRARGVGRRKTSSAVVWLVEGEGEVLVNGKSLTQFFGRLHHRESAVWALKATHRLDKYNVFGLVQGGGSTGQAEALTLAVGKALLVHEPALKPALRRGKCCCHVLDGPPEQSANIVQLAASLGIQGRWKGRRLDISRRARCPPGSSVRFFAHCILSLCISRRMCCNRLECRTSEDHRQNPNRPCPRTRSIDLDHAQHSGT